MNGFARRKKEKMDAILNAAFELFNQNGIEAVRITDIARKADVSKVSIYNYFGSKEELIKQTMYHFLDEQMQEFGLFMNSGLSFCEKFDQMVEKKMGIAEELNEGLIDFSVLTPEMLRWVHNYYDDKIKPQLVEFIQQGIREGDVDKDLSVEAVLLYMEAFKAILAQPMEMKHRMDLGKLFFYGLKGKKE